MDDAAAGEEMRESFSPLLQEMRMLREEIEADRADRRAFYYALRDLGVDSALARDSNSRRASADSAQREQTVPTDEVSPSLREILQDNMLPGLVYLICGLVALGLVIITFAR